MRNRSVFDRTIWRKLPQCFLVTAYNINCSTVPPSSSSDLVSFSPPRSRSSFISFLHVTFSPLSPASPPARSLLACSYLSICLSLKVLSLPSPKNRLCLINTSVTYLVALNFLKQTLQQLLLTPSRPDKPPPLPLQGCKVGCSPRSKKQYFLSLEEGRNLHTLPKKQAHYSLGSLATSLLPLTSRQ